MPTSPLPYVLDWIHPEANSETKIWMKMVCWEGYPRERGQESEDVGQEIEDVRQEGNKADKEGVVEQVTTCYLRFIPTRISKEQAGTCS